MQSILDLTGEDAEPADKTTVCFAGMVTSVSTKSTKNGDRMAFFRLEDRMDEIECIVFPGQFGNLSHLLRPDVGVIVWGSLSVREDEKPKVIVNRMEALVENRHFNEQTEQSVRAQQTQKAPRAAEERHTASTQSANISKPRRLFLRVSSQKGKDYFKALNLVELFDGDFPVFFFFADEKRYETEPHGFALSDYLLKQLTDLLGAENVILK